MPTRHGNALIRRQDARPVLPPRGDLIAEAGIEIPEAAHRPDRRHAAHQLIARESAYHAVCHGLRQSAAHDRLHELFIVPLFFLRLAAAGQMDVHVEKAGHQIFSGQIDRLKAHRFASCGRQSYDRFALNEDALPAQRLHILCAVQNDGVFQRVFHCFACFRA